MDFDLGAAPVAGVTSITKVMNAKGVGMKYKIMPNESQIIFCLLHALPRFQVRFMTLWPFRIPRLFLYLGIHSYIEGSVGSGSYSTL